MKKNKMFILAYAIFIFVAFIVKLCWDFPMWSPIVTAITIASCIFSCADIADVVATEYASDVKDFTPLVEDAMEKCQHVEKFYSKYDTQLIYMKEHDDNMAEVLLEGPEVIADTKKQLTEINNGLKLKKVLSSICKWLSNPLIVIGFLSFFCTITFEPVNKLLVPVQDYLTVFAFGVMMLTQYCGNSIKEDHIELEKNYKEANTALDGINEVLVTASSMLEQEAIANAD